MSDEREQRYRNMAADALPPPPDKPHPEARWLTWGDPLPLEHDRIILLWQGYHGCWWRPKEDIVPEQDATQIVITETQRELITEIEKQYRERQRQLVLSGGGSPSGGNCIIYLPYEMCREAFEGIPPVKE